MEQLVFKSQRGTPVTTSLLVAEKFEKNHRDVLRAIRNTISSAQNCAQFFYSTTYRDPSGKQNEMFTMNRDGFSLLVMGFTGQKALEFKIDFINAFNQMEQTIKNGGFMVPTTFKEALLLAAEQQEVIEAQQRLLLSQEPKVRFAEAVTGSDTNILIRDLAKLIQQSSGISIGEERLYKWLVENKYLIRTTRWSMKKMMYINDYTPTQKASELSVFFMKETVITVDDKSFTKHTVKVTPKGQQYFINKFLKIYSEELIP